MPAESADTFKFNSDGLMDDLEKELAASLAPKQAELVAEWMKFYGGKWFDERPTSGRQIREAFRYSANRLEIICKGEDADSDRTSGLKD